jgi:peptidoglycan/xylan/chitin deacetylase (PgdA/CDA1 family)
VIACRSVAERFQQICGGAPDSFHTRVFDLRIQTGDELLIQTAEHGLPLVVRRAGEVIVNFDIRAAQRFEFADSKRPIYTYLPRFHVQMIPEGIRRPISNLMQSSRFLKGRVAPPDYGKLPLTGFELSLFLTYASLTTGGGAQPGLFQWPAKKTAVFIALHDVDTAGFLERGDRDPLFRLEQKYGVRSTWFVPTAVLHGRKHAVDFLLQSGHELGWHGHRHDHRDHVRPFADRAVRALATSGLADSNRGPAGMRLPKLLKSNYIFQLIEGACPELRYDTSFLRGIVPYPLWVSGRESRILEIPTTVPTDIAVYNRLTHLPAGRRANAILEAQLSRTRQLIEAGALVSIVTHPERELSERPDFLEIYDQYLSYLRGCSDIWFTTAGELFTYWTQTGTLREPATCLSGPSEVQVR